MAMTRCASPKGCEAWAYDARNCYYHEKLVLGLIDAEWTGFISRGVSKAQVVSDEQMELARTLKELGAEPEVVQRALTRGAQGNSAMTWQRLIWREAA